MAYTQEQREYNKNYYQKHKEERKEYERKWRTEHKEQRKETQRRWYEENKEHHKELQKKWREEHKGYFKVWYQENKEYHKECILMYRYNITMEEYNQLLEDQNNKCRICEEDLKRPHVDHDHTNGKIRGILCHTCNTGLGLLKDSRNILLKAVTYLDKSC